jgi:hypothetical protein
MKKENKITFNKIFNVSDIYSPKPAIQFIPEWYRKMESSFPKNITPDSTFTIKKCIPVFDAMTSGYIIVTPCDVYVDIKDGEPNFIPTLTNVISFHSRKQAYAHPNSNEFDFPKWINPWAIVTPKGYSCLFIPPMHNPNKWFTIFEGVVDTDTYNTAVNFPFVLKETDKEFLIPAGTPIAQVIPFKRENWQSFISDEKTKSNKTLEKINSKFFNRYKDLLWKKKSYK